MFLRKVFCLVILKEDLFGYKFRRKLGIFYSENIIDSRFKEFIEIKVNKYDAWLKLIQLYQKQKKIILAKI